MFILTFANDVGASFLICQSDSTGYSEARVVGSPPVCYYNKDSDKDYGILEVCGDHNLPAGSESCKMEVMMHFQAPEDCYSFRIGAAWSLSYKIETTAPWYGYAYITIRYVLYDSDMSTAIETHSCGWAISCHTDWWGSDDSEYGTKSMSVDDYVLFQFDLSSGTWYYAAVQLYITLDGEANAWSQSGYENPVYLDVADIVVYN